MVRGTKTVGFVLTLALLLSAGPAQAQLAPTPRKSPRTPVRQERLYAPAAPSLPASRAVAGAATVLDSERLKIDGIEMRLFGVVPPLLSASYGPQARSTLDALSRGDVTCRIRDRTRDGHLLASCRNGENLDLGLELLRRGLAVTARGTLHGTDLSAPYIAAEEAAKAQHLGLWSVAQPAAASESSIQKAAQKEKEKEQAAKEQAVKDSAKEEAKLEPTAAPSSPPPMENPAAVQAFAQPAAATPAAKAADPAAEAASSPVPAPPAPSPALAPEAAAETVDALAPQLDEAVAEEPFSLGGPDFIERYQLLISGLILLLAACVWTGGSAFLRNREKKDSLRALAAALRGELMAARSICLARLARLAKETDDKSVSWPRLRSLVFQAYVGQLGRLGADLSRQIASIYGQSADYASYYVGAEGKPETASKKQSLQTLVQHIEDVVPRLADIEQRGALARTTSSAAALALLARVKAPLSLGAPTKPGRPAPRPTLPAPEDQGDEIEIRNDAEEPAQSFGLEEEEQSRPAEQTAQAEEPKETPQKPEAKKEEKPAPAAETKSRPTLAEKKKPAAPLKAKERATVQQTQKTVAAAKEVLLSVLHDLDFRAPFAEGLAQVRNYAADKWGRLNAPLSASIEDIMPDYANLTEEELEALAYADEYLYGEEESEKDRKTG